MVIATIIIGIILLFFVCLLFYIDNRRDGNYEEGAVLGIIVTSLLFIEGILIYFINSDTQPSAMDVYKGKTTLEYKVVDDVKVNNVVIFKNDNHGKD